MKTLSIMIALVLALGISTEAMAGKSGGTEKNYYSVELKDAF